MSEGQWSRAFLAGLGVCVFVFIVTLVRLRGPGPQPPEATGFSAVRAKALLDSILAEGTPHPVGTPENRRIRDRIVAHLRDLGYDPQIDRRWECYGWADCAEVENILVRREGSSGEAVLLAAHYDSVGAAPGAADDGTGVVVLLEVARLLKNAPPSRNPLILLITDGEEAGLIGAAAFIHQHPWAKQVRSVINLEARGSSGPSFMFETNRGNGWLIGQMARSVPRPATSSLYQSIYERLPNDTDFTVFKAAGIQGLNFAFIGGIQHYHTSLDNLRSLSLRSLQHHGDNAWAMTRTLLSADLSRPRSPDAVFFDVFSWRVIRWPASWVIPLTLMSVVVLVVGMVTSVRRGVGMRDLLWGLISALLSLVLIVGVAAGANILLRATGAAPSQWLAYPAAALTFFYTASFAIPLLLAGRTTVWGLWCAGGILWTAFAIVLALILPGGAYLFLIPSLVINLSMLAWGGTEGRSMWSGFALTAFVASTLAFATAWPLYDGMGLGAMPVVGILAGLTAMTIAPAFAASSRSARRIVAVSGIAIPVIALIVALFLPPFSPERPRRLTLLLHRDADEKQARWLLRAGEGQLPERLQSAAAWEQQLRRPFPWDPRAVYFAAPAQAIDLPVPEVSIERGRDAAQRSVIRLHLVPVGDPVKMAVVVPDSGIESVRVNGRATTPQSPRRQRAAPAGWLRLTLHTVPPAGATIEFLMRDQGRLEGFVEQRWRGLPASAVPLRGARPASAVPSHDGDFTIALKAIRINHSDSSPRSE
jgi:hypothetical protein